MCCRLKLVAHRLIASSLSERSRFTPSVLARSKHSSMSSFEVSGPSSASFAATDLSYKFSLALPTEPFYQFGPYRANAYQIFITSPLSYATVNLKPILPGHVMAVPKRVVQHFADLTDDEVTDLFLLSKRIAALFSSKLDNTAYTFSMQDGADAGQTVPHVHFHILPRFKGDFDRNDDVYSKLEEKTEIREPRTPAQMTEEAEKYRQWFAELISSGKL